MEIPFEFTKILMSPFNMFKNDESNRNTVQAKTILPPNSDVVNLFSGPLSVLISQYGLIPTLPAMHLTFAVDDTILKAMLQIC